MRRFFATLVVISWGLWVGAIPMLFMAVQCLFVTFADQRELAGAAASAIFYRFNVYQLVLGLAAIVGSVGVQAGNAGKRNTTLLGLFGFAMAAALLAAVVITPRIETLRIAGNVHSDEFRRLHGLSMIVYCAGAISLLLAGLVLPGSGRAGRRR